MACFQFLVVVLLSCWCHFFSLCMVTGVSACFAFCDMQRLKLNVKFSNEAFGITVFVLPVFFFFLFFFRSACPNVCECVCVQYSMYDCECVFT